MNLKQFLKFDSQKELLSVSEVQHIFRAILKAIHRNDRIKMIEQK